MRGKHELSFGHCSGVAADGAASVDVSPSGDSLRLGDAFAGRDFDLNGLDNSLRKARNFYASS